MSDWIEFESSNIKRARYSPGLLQIEFKSGGVYEYEDVTLEQWQEFLNSPSKGRHFQSAIRGRFPTRKIN